MQDEADTIEACMYSAGQMEKRNPDLYKLCPKSAVKQDMVNKPLLSALLKTMFRFVKCYVTPEVYDAFEVTPLSCVKPVSSVQDADALYAGQNCFSKCPR